MSERKVTIEIEAPSTVRNTARRETETIVSPGHACSYCRGRGYFTGDVDRCGDEVRHTCPVCNGSGEMDAVVRIEWKPARRKK